MKHVYVLMRKDSDDEDVPHAVYANRDEAVAIVERNKAFEISAQLWDEAAEKFPVVVTPDEPMWGRFRRPDKIESREYLEWLTAKLDHDAKLKEWLEMRVRLANERNAAIVAKHGERPKYFRGMHIYECDVYL